MPVRRTRRSQRFLLGCVLALLLASGLAACNDSSGDNPAPEPTETAASPAPATPVPPAEPPQPPTTSPEAPVPEPPAGPVAPAASPPPAELASPAISASEPAAMPGEPSPPPAESPAPEPAPQSFLYDTYDRSGTVTEPGHYAFLADSADPASVVTTYEELRDGSATVLLIHTHDAHGVSQAAFYDAVETGDLVEWKQADDCFVRYTVTDAPAPAAGAVPRAFGVAWMTYAFTGCSGAISTASDSTDSTTTTTVDVTWGAVLPDLGGTSLTAPIRHGLFFQIVPHNWTGETEPITWLPIPPGGFEEDTYADTVAEARRFPFWREPTLPDGTQFRSAATGPEEAPYGYWAQWRPDAEGNGHSVKISAGYVIGQGGPYDAAWYHKGTGTLNGTYEAHVIAGRPALVLVLEGGRSPVHISIYDPTANAVWRVVASAIDAWDQDGEPLWPLRVAQSLFEPPNPP